MMHRGPWVLYTLSLLTLSCATPQPRPAPAVQPQAASPREPARRAATEQRFAKSGIADWTVQPPPTAEPEFEPPRAKRFELPNGIAVLTVEDHALPIVSFTLLAADAGAAVDPRDKPGLAAYTADLLDEGAGELSAIQIAEELARLGAAVEIDVDVDAAQLSVDTLSATLEPTLELFTKILTRPRFDAAEAERVKGDRMTSLALRRDRPREVANLVLSGALYGPDTPYGHPVSGSREDFAKVNVKDARAFYAQRWQPARMTLVVAGDVDPATLIPSLRRSLGAWKPASPRLGPPPIAAANAPGSRLLLVDRRAAAQSDIRIGLIGPARTDPRFFAFEVFRTVLGDGFTSRLVQRLREQLGITYGVSARMDWRVRPGPFLIGGAIVTPATAQGLGEILRIVGELGTEDVPSEELDKAKQNLIRALPARFETNGRTADTFAELALFGLPDDWYARYAEGMRAVSEADVRAVAGTVVPAERLVFSVVGDLAATQSTLAALELGAPAFFGPEGNPLPATTPGR
jgi:predicted Zn-dependent peptidase